MSSKVWTVRSWRDKLTRREQQVAELSIKGNMLNKQIAETLGITESTVKGHRGKAFKKLGVNGATELARIDSMNLEELLTELAGILDDEDVIRLHHRATRSSASYASAWLAKVLDKRDHPLKRDPWLKYCLATSRNPLKSL